MGEQLLIQNGDHLIHFGQCLVETHTKDVWSDVVLHLDDGSGRQFRTHRVVLASVSEFLASLLTQHPSYQSEDEVHLTLAEMDYDSVKIILDFAYDGEAKIPRSHVETVCEVANQLRVKFLKDSFVKVNQKEYQEIRAGRKSLKSLGGSPPPPPPHVLGSPPVKRSIGRVSAGSSGRKAAAVGSKIKKKKLSESDTDSADSDEETHRIAATAAGDAGELLIGVVLNLR